MKSKIFTGLFLLLILVANFSFASYHTVTMSVIEEPVCLISLGEHSKFEKKLWDKNLANKEVTLQLQVTNEEIADKPTGEIMIVLDNSDSMNTIISDTTITRKELIFNCAQKLVSSLLKDNDKLKIGITSFSTNVDQNKEATIADASLVSPLATDVSTLNTAISKIKANGSRTNLQSGVLLASRQFTNQDNNKYMIILTDGVPNVAIDYDGTYYSEDVISKTKEQLKALDTQGINLITMLTGISNENFVPSTTTKNLGQIIKEVFGTQTNPTAGKFYYITDKEIEKTITNDIYNALVPIEKSLKDITIVDYFPEEIIKNFDFAYVSNATIGNISISVDTKTNSITWKIPELVSGQTATVQYKLKLKENFDSAIIDKILNTNQKVDLEYVDFNDVQQAKTSDISPKIQLTEPPIILPKAGTTTLFGFSILVAFILIGSIIKLTIIHNKMN